MEIELVVVPWSSFNLMSYVISIFDIPGYVYIYLNNIITLTVTYTCGIMCVN